ncbi:LysR family transcriptional regulator [Verminephrobacter eiseniae]|uniref:Transcriptional regulator, LysR family n=1 Tax=Verminephrobacter eiseniae (strain EF01-2) TaxID=391735 RepID=A1WHL2_VEREI|nr:LysR family transcriptional regulator [Verminephrobacter eiseniae]ABM57119.1 transcriptional regulator, LysR family [Verminephrobacter eiseniae EF01-2]MCW5287453.1 LysR family transcriptional regulator [Verminephrobacter eiseniae]MCW5305752.1 LysR family transcriptional regulator [Verminephrobacter eiseniae]MCW8182699.1 LysR family transcriptional regulator [Verminephrobacter eiseniae]MCW8192828.1 LysR family transcriptional regulator [Verminephrobacter eiseniae]
MNFDLSDMRAFVAVADLGSFRAAAQTLHISQPALSRRVEKLEQAMGFRLFERTTRKVELSAIGRSFVPKARHVLSELENALLGMTDMSDRLRGQVTVACVPSSVPHLLAGAVEAFQRKFPRIRVRLIDETATEILLAVVRSEADFGVSYWGAQEPDLEFQGLVQEPFVLACLPGHPLARKRRVKWAELAQHDCVTLPPGTGNRMLIDQALSTVAYPPRWTCEARHVPALLSLIEAGVGVGAVPRFAIRGGQGATLASVRLVEPEVTRTIGVIKRRARPLMPAAQAFHDLLVAAHRASSAQARPLP